MSCWPPNIHNKLLYLYIQWTKLITPPKWQTLVIVRNCLICSIPEHYSSNILLQGNPKGLHPDITELPVSDTRNALTSCMYVYS